MPAKRQVKTRGSRKSGKVTTKYRDSKGNKVTVKKYYDAKGRHTGTKAKSGGAKTKVKFGIKKIKKKK